ncbi:MAG: SPOR domain-containing protein [Magnetococcales bacterium]|nr:SPOR domain-containing protein [Magnetococcales bacterium]NGZ27804.1 SPOR domain-containing protein [Magnetococcales bacterium]
MRTPFRLSILLSLALVMAGCTNLSKNLVPPLPSPAPLPPPAVEAPPPEIRATPRENLPKEKQSLVWVYPLFNDQSGTVLTEKTRLAASKADYRWQDPPNLTTTLPPPNQVKGSATLAKAGVGYVVVPHVETGPAGFLTLEIYRPPNPALSWVTSIPLANHSDPTLALEHAMTLLTNHLSRHVQQVTISQLNLPSGQNLVNDAPLPAAGAIWEVQTGAFLMEENAKDAMEELRKRGYAPYQVEVKDQMERLWHVVRVGKYPTRERAEILREQLEQKEKLSGYITFSGKF